MRTADETMEAVILRRLQAADGIASPEPVSPGGAPLPAFEPGAHVDVHAAPGIVRQYSFCADPARHARYRFG